MEEKFSVDEKDSEELKEVEEKTVVEEDGAKVENKKQDPSKKKPWKVVSVILQVLLVVLCVSFFVLLKVKPELFVKQNSNPAMDNIKVSTDMVESGQIAQNQAMTYFMGYDDQSVSTEGTIPLGNEGKNAEDNIYMQFTILGDDGKEIYQSDLIAPGMEIQWKPSDYLDVGTHLIVFHEQPYKIIDTDKELDESNLQALYYIDQNVTLTITE